MLGSRRSTTRDEQGHETQNSVASFACVFGFKIRCYNTHRNPLRHSLLKSFPQVKYPVTCLALSRPHKILAPRSWGQPRATPQQSSPGPYTSALVSLDSDSTWLLGQPHHPSCRAFRVLDKKGEPAAVAEATPRPAACVSLWWLPIP